MRFRARIGLQIAWMIVFAAMWAVALLVLARWVPGRRLALIAAIALFIGGLGARLAVRKLARPIEMLAEASRRFGAGDLTTRVTLPARLRHRHPSRRHVHGVDEIGALAQAWNEMAERIERLVAGQRELFANVSHELRSPLARMRVALELLPRTPETEARIAAVADDIIALDELIEDVLTASRLDAAPRVRREPVDLAALLAGVQARAADDPLCRDLEVRVEADGAGAMAADPALLRRALGNLVENAAKYGAPPIVLGAERLGDTIRLSVSDAGPGIPAEERSRLLEPFQRRDAARTPGEGRSGVGLGLTIARRVAEVHGGHLTLSAAGSSGDAERGLRATLSLPLTGP